MSIAPVEQESVSSLEETEVDVPWITLVWNDPVNLMSYVTFVFQSYFGYPKAKAERLMLDVHTKVIHGTSTSASSSVETLFCSTGATDTTAVDMMAGTTWGTGPP